MLYAAIYDFEGGVQKKILPVHGAYCFFNPQHHNMEKGWRRFGARFIGVTLV